MTTCLGKSYSFGLLCVSFVNVNQFFCVCSSFPFSFKGGRWDMIVLIPDHCLFTVELQWLEHLWNHEIMFETGVVRTKEC